MVRNSYSSGRNDDRLINPNGKNEPQEFVPPEEEGAHVADVLPCQTAAAATVHVGNGARDTVFTDHLLLGRDEREDWRILDKVFAPRPWPTG